MGLGTKIKEALSGDKPHNHGSQRRKTPGAYPESSVDIPRTATTDTWQSTKRSSPGAKDEDIAEKDELNEYTHTPLTENPTQNDEEFVPSPDSRIAGNHNGRLSKDYNRQPPYWGNVGKADTRQAGTTKRDATNPLNNDSITKDAGHAADENYLDRSGTVNSSTHPALRGETTARPRDNAQFQTPIGSVNRGQPQLVDDEAARATSMAASNVSQPTQIDDDYGNAGLTYGGAAYNSNQNANANQYDENYGVQRTGTINGREPVTNARGTFGSPVHRPEERSFSPQQGVTNHSWPHTADASGNSRFAHGGDESYPQNYAAAGINTRDFSNTYPTGQKMPEQPNREQVSPAMSSENGSRGASQTGGDHYGPGHSGAKVMHRCQHCGNDNDITKYFSRDVVYRLS